jgi:hypothetical protein
MLEKTIQRLLNRHAKATLKGAITLTRVITSVTCVYFFMFGSGNLIWW